MIKGIRGSAAFTDASAADVADDDVAADVDACNIDAAVNVFECVIKEVKNNMCIQLSNDYLQTKYGECVEFCFHMRYTTYNVS